MHSETIDVAIPLAEADWQKLEELLEDECWPETMLNAEAIDGVIAASLCGPRGVKSSEVIPLIFGLTEMPDISLDDKYQRLLQLFFRRWNEYSVALMIDIDNVTEENFIQPFYYDDDPEQWAIAKAWKPPPEAGKDDWRPGDWAGRAWATGFMSAVSARREAWLEIATLDENCIQLLSPILLLELGFNREHPTLKFSPHKLMPAIIANLYHLSHFYRMLDKDYVEKKPIVRETPKVGRNDACPCGSGKKFKKCCGVAKVTH